MSAGKISKDVIKPIAAWPGLPECGAGLSSSLGEEFEALRCNALGNLSSYPLPQAGDELWRFTRLQQFAMGSAGESSGVRLELQDADSRQVLEIPGVRVFEGREAFTKAGELLRHLSGAAQDDIASHGVAHYQTALTQSLHLVTVERNTRVTTPVLLSQIPLKKASRQCVPWIVILLEPGAQATLIEDLDFDFEGVYFPRLEIVARGNSSFDFISTQRFDNRTMNLGRHRFHLERDVSARVLHAFLGAKASRVDLDCRMLGEGASIDLRSVYIADGHRHVDFHPTQEHVAPNCQSRLLCKGVVKDKARSVYYGYIRVAEEAQRTDAYQTNRNLIFSSDARADSIPNLEIKANDVRCSHGSSVGQVGAEELFYLMSRGLTREMSEKLLVEGFFEEVFSGFSSKEVCLKLGDAIMERLQYGSRSSRD